MNITRPVVFSRGLTLIELLVAMSVFSLLGLFLFTLMRGSLAMYRSAQGSAESFDKFDISLTTLAEDLQCLSIGDPTGPGLKTRFLLTHDRKWVPPQGVNPENQRNEAKTFAPGDPRSFLLRFVRTLPQGELSHPIARFSGLAPNPEAYLDGNADDVESRADRFLRVLSTEDDEPTRDPSLLPTLGLQEVMYFLDSGRYDSPGTYTLYRVVRSPPGGRGSFFDPATLDGMTPEWIERHAEPVVSGVAFFGMVLWSQYSTSWDTERVLDGSSVPIDGDDAPARSAEFWWDSTRGLSDRFSLRKGAISALNFEDDVYPLRAQVVVTFVQESSKNGDTLLVGSLPALARELSVANPAVLEGAAGEVFVKAGDEWMEVLGVEGTSVRVKRGVRSTSAAPHAPGAALVVGRTFRQVVDIPAGRSYFRAPGENK